MLRAIDVEPMPALAHETAGFMQPHCPPADAIARHEFHLGMRCVDGPVAPDFQSQPVHAGLKIDLCRARAGVPGGQQPGGVFLHKGAVARAHEAFGIGRRCAAAAPAPTAVDQREWLAPGGKRATGTRGSQRQGHGCKIVGDGNARLPHGLRGSATPPDDGIAKRWGAC